MSRKPWRFSRTRGPYRVVVQSREIVDDRTYYTCVHPKTGQAWPMCLPLSLGGGGLDVFAQVPLKLPDTPPSDYFVTSPEKAHAAEALLCFDTHGARYIVGCTSREQTSALLDATPDVEEYETHPKTFGPGDYVLSNGAGEVVGRVIVDEAGRVAIAASTVLRLQVDEGGKIIGHEDGRVSLPVVVLEPTLDYLNAQTARINANTQQLMLLSPGAIAADRAAATAATAAGAVQAGLGNAAGAAVFYMQAATLTEHGNQLQSWLDDATLSPVLPDADNLLGSPTMTAPSRAQ